MTLSILSVNPAELLSLATINYINFNKIKANISTQSENVIAHITDGEHQVTFNTNLLSTDAEGIDALRKPDSTIDVLKLYELTTKADTDIIGVSYYHALNLLAVNQYIYEYLDKLGISINHDTKTAHSKLVSENQNEISENLLMLLVTSAYLREDMVKPSIKHVKLISPNEVYISVDIRNTYYEVNHSYQHAFMALDVGYNLVVDYENKSFTVKSTSIIIDVGEYGEGWDGVYFTELHEWAMVVDNTEDLSNLINVDVLYEQFNFCEKSEVFLEEIRKMIFTH